ncbi:MAG TPA: DEAD/DEAH box helicase [Myxococcota bacterium]|nr:DEAD/DEAH box helicase [Myxococcota bacterium]
MSPTFDTFPFAAELHAALRDMGFAHPTPIQVKAIPLALEGRDLIACASTGTGKTAAFVLPTLQRLHGGERGKVRALVLSPTRELALQIDEQILALGYHLDITAASVVGGVDFGPQEEALKAGADIVVATPGRLLDHMRYGYVDFSAVEVLVLDEADRMFDMGFLPDLKRIVAKLPTDRQTLLFSATMPPSVRDLADEILRDPSTVAVDPQKPAKNIVHRSIASASGRKTQLLVTMLRHPAMRSVIVFVKRKKDADHIARAVTRGAVQATSIHSDRSQAERNAALDAFRRGECPVMVATDVAARGIDVDGVTHVIHYDVPMSSEDYIHRSGRTARAGATGQVFTFVSPDEEADFAAIEKAIGMKIQRVAIRGFDDGLRDGKDPDARPSAHRRRAPQGVRIRRDRG